VAGALFNSMGFDELEASIQKASSGVKMKAKIISVGLVILLMGLAGFGCYPIEEINDMEAQIAELEGQVADLKEENKELQKEVETLRGEVKALQEESEKAEPEEPEEPTSEAVKIEFEPSPVPCKQGEWRWRVILKEVNGVGVKINSITMEVYAEDSLILSWEDKDWVEFFGHYLPANDSVSSSRHLPYKEGTTHVIFIVSGVDDNGNEVAAEGRVELLPSKSATAEIQVSFSANPVPCEKGMWQWRHIYTEVNGIGVTFEKIETSMYRNSRLLDTRITDVDFLAGKLPDAYLPAYGTIDWGAGWPCQDMTHVVFTITGIDDNGNEITATGRVDLER